jgi:hypothetical protein
MKYICSLFFLFAVAACHDTDVNRNSIEYFRNFLKEDMAYSDLRLIFGEPDADIGSGIHMYVYNVNDGTQVIIGYTDRIIYARHINDTDVIAELI